MSTLSLRTIFLIDGLGAILSAIMLGVLLPIFQTWIGMPLTVLFTLAFLALAMALNSLWSFFSSQEDKALDLKVTIAANVIYCLITSLLMIFFYDQLRTLGLCYFLAELILVVILVIIEIRAYASKRTRIE